MPYRGAHWWVVALFPVIGLAFWPNYWSQMTRAPFALHAHGLTASLWMILVAAQSWTIHARRTRLHRQLGLALFVAVPLFAAGGALALQSMAGLFVNQVTPFHIAFGARLGVADAIGGPVLVGLVAYGLVRRRQARVHAVAMLATVVLVLPPVFGRLAGYVPGLGDLSAATGLDPFVYGFHGGQLIAVLLGLWLAQRDPAGRAPFLVVAGASLAQMVGFETLGRTGVWESLMAGLTTIPSAALATPAALVAAAILWWAWRRVPPRIVPTTRAAAAA